MACVESTARYRSALRLNLSLRHVSMHEKMPVAFDLSHLFVEFSAEMFRSVAANRLSN